MTVDQPLFAIAKNVAWTWPDEYREYKLVVPLRGLHIEMAFFGAIGNFLKQSG